MSLFKKIKNKEVYAPFVHFLPKENIDKSIFSLYNTLQGSLKNITHFNVLFNKSNKKNHN